MKQLWNMTGPVLGLAALLLLGVHAAQAEDVTAQASTSNQSISLGSTTIDGEQWQRLAFRREMPFGKLAIAMDIEFFVNSEGGLSSRGWQFGNFNQVMSTLYRKIYYVRYGQPRDPVYVRLMGLDDVTLGYGFLMSHYRNTLDYPGVKNLGVHFELNPAGGISVQGVLNNLLDITNGGPVVGARVAKGLGPFEVGASLVYDVDQYGGLADNNDDGLPDALEPRVGADGVNYSQIRNPSDQDQLNSILVANGQPPINWARYARQDSLYLKGHRETDSYGMVGADVAMKLIDRPSLALITYGQMGISLDDNDRSGRATGWGFGAPGLMAVFGPVRARIEYRHLRDEFQPEYFNSWYDHTRATVSADSGVITLKDASLNALAGQTLNGVFGDASVRVPLLGEASAQYQYLHGPTNQQRLSALAGVDQGLLQMVPKLSRIEAFYAKDNIGLYGDGFFQKTVDMSYGYRVGFTVAPSVEMIWSTRWLFRPVGSDPLVVEPQRQITFATVFNF
ncbi:MAG TPA: hypothetical protein PLT86_11220 [Candidatus Latescibacteria bacterium]|jgi:hypothetical protein|nr:hypothetical protein [Candidatus Latescibacterota bacterium]HQI75919.1 hypothetical protein [Candidatus Latescibacterota bacterium]